MYDLQVSSGKLDIGSNKTGGMIGGLGGRCGSGSTLWTPTSGLEAGGRSEI
jgi:hypothetical protein